MKNGSDDETVPSKYLSNENPYAYCKDYHKNSVNIPEKRTRLSLLQRMQPSKINFKMPHKHLDMERQTQINAAVAHRRAQMIQKGLAILGLEYHDDPEELFDRYIDNPEILEIALEIKKYKLVHHQRRLRSKVSFAITKKLSEDIEYHVGLRNVLEIDNLKDALVFCKLEDLYENKE